jgi:flagellar biosynthesis/type III secretory pathway M-ring protein FliF/YscJ
VLGLGGLIFLIRIFRRTSSAMAALKPGTRVRDADMAMGLQSGESWELVSGDNSTALRERARELSRTDPGKAAHLLRAWVQGDVEAEHAAKENAHV